MNRAVPWYIPFLSGIAVLTAHAILWFGGLYAAIPFVDMPLHFSGGAIVALAVLSAAPLLKSGESRVEFAILVFCIATTVGVLWEFFELTLDRVLQTGFQNSIVDTLKDIGLAMVGAALVVAWNCIHRGSDKTEPVGVDNTYSLRD